MFPTRTTRILLLIIFAVLNTENSYGSKKFKDIYFASIGMSTGTCMSSLPAYRRIGISSGSSTYFYPGEIRYNNYNFSFFSFGYNARINLMEFDKDHALSFNLYPLLGIGGSGEGILSFDMPLYIGYEIGNVSTYQAKRKKGYSFGLGAQYINAGLIPMPVVLEDESYKIPKGVISKIEPCAVFAIRYWNRRDKAKEWNLRFGYKPSPPVNIETLTPYEKVPGVNSSWTIRITWVQYLDY